MVYMENCVAYIDSTYLYYTQQCCSSNQVNSLGSSGHHIDHNCVFCDGWT